MKKIIVFACLSLLILGCEPFSSTKAVSSEETLLPGECLKSPRLELEEFRINDYRGPYSFVFPLIWDRAVIKEKRYTLSYGYFPERSVFEAFGDNAEAVRLLYLEACKGLRQMSFLSTVFYDDGISLVADKDFAGIEAGKNIAEGAMIVDDWKEAKQTTAEASTVIMEVYPIDFINTALKSSYDFKYSLFSYGVCLCVPIGDFKVVEEDVTFHFEMPVKVAMYLTWLNETISNPNAPMIYQDETLTCTFTIPKGLH